MYQTINQMLYVDSSPRYDFHAESAFVYLEHRRRIMAYAHAQQSYSSDNTV
jgi:hypothetical protein